MNESTRPKRVVVVDAENPLEEIRGEFFWREDHDQIVAAARESAYARGYADGVAAGRRTPRTVVVRYRHGLIRRTVTTIVVALIALAFAISLVSSMVGSVHSP